MGLKVVHRLTAAEEHFGSNGAASLQVNCPRTHATQIVHNITEARAFYSQVTGAAESEETSDRVVLTLDGVGDGYYAESIEQRLLRQRSYGPVYPTMDQIRRMEHIRENAGTLSQMLNENCPEGVELNDAQRLLRQTVDAATRAIARGETPPEIVEPEPEPIGTTNPHTDLFTSPDIVVPGRNADED